MKGDWELYLQHPGCHKGDSGGGRLPTQEEGLGISVCWSGDCVEDEDSENIQSGSSEDPRWRDGDWGWENISWPWGWGM